LRSNSWTYGVPSSIDARHMKGTPTRSRLAPAKEIARETGIPYTSLRDLVFRGELPVLRIGRAWYFERADVDRYIETRKERGGV
jgi:excisionase family DNA binding protein